jgi:PAS domain S-box-containing protein
LAGNSNAQIEEAIESLPFSMVLASAELPDQPIVYVNERFEQTTGYSAESVIGINCRFLQGDATDPAKVQEINNGLASGHDVTVDLENYKADGTPFRNRLLISPIRDESGAVVSYLGIQRELPDGVDAPPTATDDLLLSELQHRVKNHLAMIVGLIRMHA